MNARVVILPEDGHDGFLLRFEKISMYSGVLSGYPGVNGFYKRWESARLGILSAS